MTTTSPPSHPSLVRAAKKAGHPAKKTEFKPVSPRKTSADYPAGLVLPAEEAPSSAAAELDLFSPDRRTRYASLCSGVAAGRKKNFRREVSDLNDDAAEDAEMRLHVHRRCATFSRAVAAQSARRSFAAKPPREPAAPQV